MRDPGNAFRIGAVGHRLLEGPPQAIQERITEVLLDLKSARPDEQISIVSSAAEGADRLVLASARSIGLPWELALPCSPACFCEDFETDRSRAEFDELLEDARFLLMPDPPIDKESGYLWASEAVLAGSDILVAVWDGGPGHGAAGTAATVARARERGIPVIWIPTHPPMRVRRLDPAQTERRIHS